jgi:predicted nucleic acid-binding protein
MDSRRKNSVIIHLDTNVLIGLSTEGAVAGDRVEKWLEEGRVLAASSTVWFEYISGPVPADALGLALAALQGGILPFDSHQAEKAPELYNLTGRRRAMRFDCMIAAGAIIANATLATSNAADFLMFVPFGLKLEVV